MVRPVGRGLGPSADGCPGDGRWREVSRGVGDAAPYGLPGEWAVTGACPSSGPAGPPSPEGEGKGCCWRQRERLRGVGDAAPYGLPGEGRQQEPAPHPALRGHLPPRGKARAVVGGNASLRGASGTPPPTVCPGTDGDGRSRRGGGTPPYGWGYGNTVGLTRAAVPGPPCGRGRACPARGFAWAEVCGSVCREGS